MASITYDPNGGTGTVDGKTVDAGAQVDAAQNAYKRTGYKFQNWNTKPDGTGIAYSPADLLTLDDDVTLYAIWTPNAYKVAYDANTGGGSMPEQAFKYDVAQNLDANTFAKPGWTFTGWNTKPDGGGTAYKDAQQITNLTAQDGGEVTLYAQWKADPATLHYDANAGDATGRTPDSTGVTGQTVTVEDNGYQREGYTFTGWNTMPDGTGDPLNPDDKYTLPAGESTVYAQWEEIPGSVDWVKTDATSGDILPGSEWRLDGPDGRSVTVADNTGADPDDADMADVDTDAGGFKVTNLAWGDWTLTETRAPEGHDPIAEPLTFTIDARHTAVHMGDVENTRTPAAVTYDANGGTGETGPYEGVVGDVPTAAENGFAVPDECAMFAGWNTKADGTGAGYRPGDALPPLTGDLTLYTQWTDAACLTGDALARTGTATGLPATACLLAALLAAMAASRRRGHGR